MFRKYVIIGQVDVFQFPEERMTLLTVGSKEARSNWRDILDRVLAGENDILIERNGKLIAAIIPASDYEELMDELEDLRSARRAAAAYEAWKKKPTSGRLYTEIRQELIEAGVIDEQEYMDSDPGEAS
jgi:prevent-host-death family protein